MKNNIKLYRVKHRLSQEELSKILEVSRQTLSSIENNKYFPSLELGLKMAQILKCRVEDLFSL